MGLDLLEYTLALEQSFGIAIPDSDVVHLKTARQVVDYVAGRLAPLGPDRCGSQQAFYALRSAVSRAFDVPADTVLPVTKWATVFGRRPRSDWRLLQHAVGVAEWPSFLWTAAGPSTATVGETAEYLAVQSAVASRRPDALWSRREIEFVVRGLAAEDLGISDLPWDAEFVRDLGCG